MSGIPTEVVEVKYALLWGGCLGIPPLWILLDIISKGKDMKETPLWFSGNNLCE